MLTAERESYIRKFVTSLGTNFEDYEQHRASSGISPDELEEYFKKNHPEAVALSKKIRALGAGLVGAALTNPSGLAQALRQTSGMHPRIIQMFGFSVWGVGLSGILTALVAYFLTGSGAFALGIGSFLAVSITALVWHGVLKPCLRAPLSLDDDAYEFGSSVE